MMRNVPQVAAALAGLALLAAAPPPPGVANPALWPKAQSPFHDPRVEARVAALMAAMSVDDKVGQIIQVDIASLKPEDLREIKVGSILNGGNSAPGGYEEAPPKAWLDLADAFWAASMTRSDGRPKIPVIWGTDAVHGHNNLAGATLFPHNIGLGAMRDPELMRRIGAATAAEVAATGIDWSFGPTLAVAQDDRWGRTYESYSEEPSVVASYAGAIVEGVQGQPGTRDFLSPGHVLATAKHFLGDGGTNGHDQGDTRVDEATLVGVHAAGYPPAIRAGVATMMISLSSWNGAKTTGNESLLTEVLKRRMGFDGLLVGDWDGHGQLPGCVIEHCPSAINAGLDMFMVAGDWKALYRNTLEDVRTGAIPMARLDDAVRRILRVKAMMGVLDAGRPSSRAAAGRFEELGSPVHRAIARQAVRESLVLLKNEGGLLPLRPQSRILVAGRGADDIAQQAGGWTITWQGTDVSNKDFPHAQSIWGGVREAVGAAGGQAVLSPDGSFAQKPDAAIVVFGETPYAEFAGDRATLEYSPADKSDLALLRRLKAQGVPVVAVFLSGRPLWVNAELNASDAFVAAFLPGSEGGGVADLLFRKPGGAVAHDFRGRLSFSWPRRPDQYALNRRDPGYDPLFPFGYGLTYAAPGHVAKLDEAMPASLAAGPPAVFYGRSGVPDGWKLTLAQGDGWPAPAKASRAETPGRWLTMIPVDRTAQEDSRRLTWSGEGMAKFAILNDRPLDLSRAAKAGESLVVEARLDAAPTAPVTLTVASGMHAYAVPLAPALAKAAAGGWTTLAIPLRCFTDRGVDPALITPAVTLATAGKLTLTISDVRIAAAPQTVACGG